jgi:hypothetical protein
LGNDYSGVFLWGLGIRDPVTGDALGDMKIGCGFAAAYGFIELDRIIFRLVELVSWK